MEALNLQDNHFTDSGLYRLMGKQRLKVLWIGLGDGLITDAGLHYLRNFNSLEVLEVQNNPRISARGRGTRPPAQAQSVVADGGEHHSREDAVDASDDVERGVSLVRVAGGPEADHGGRTACAHRARSSRYCGRGSGRFTGICAEVETRATVPRRTIRYSKMDREINIAIWIPCGNRGIGTRPRIDEYSNRTLTVAWWD